MIGKNQGQQPPTALGSLLQASTYGLAIQIPYGRCQSPLYAIWAQNLRQGGSTKKFKQLKKGVTAYVENIDFLLGKNPIQGVLQMWNNGALFPLNDEVYEVAVTAGAAGIFVVPDVNFYAVLGVTLEVAYDVTFDDYGSQGSSTLTGTFEVPLWNQLFAGPDPTASTDPRNWPYCYRWRPSYGATVYVDQLEFGQLPSGNLRIYYSQLSNATDPRQSPISRVRLSFENELGSGDEYDGYSSQQIIYPHYAGAGSQDIDLGATGTIPALKAELQGKWGYTPAGDADFVDIIEDIVKSGITQAALGGSLNFGQTEHGTGSYNLPGTIQKKLATSNNSSGLPAMLYDMPNTIGNILVVSAFGQGGLTIASSNAETWTPIFAPGSVYQVWWAVAIGGDNTVTVSGAGQPSEVCIMEVGGVGVADVALDSFTTVFPGVASNASGGVVKNFTNPLGPYYCTANWGNFSMIQPLPSDAVIQGIYPVLVASYAHDGCSIEAAYGVGASSPDCSSPPGGLIFTIPATGFSSTEFSEGSIGTSLSDLVGVGMAVALSGSTGPTNGLVDSVDVTALGYAVYYTSAHPFTDAIIPPPFTVPVGQGVAWALPGTFAPTCNFASSTGPQAQAAAGSAATWTPATVVTTDTPIITETAESGFSVDTSGTTARKGSISTSVATGWPAYLLAIPFYSAGDSPPSAQVAKWEALTPENFYDQALANFQAHGKIVKNPGSYSFNSPGTDPTALAMLSIKFNDAPQFPQPSGSFIDIASMDLTRAQCRAGNLVGSLSMITQRSASDWITDLAEAADCSPVLTGFKLKLLPRSEVSAVGNGAIYNAPTASGPVANLSTLNGDFVASKGQSAIKVTRAARKDTDTVFQMQHINRSSGYQQVITAEPDAAGIAIYGVRKADPKVNDAVQDVSIARSILSIGIRRLNYIEILKYEFTLNQRWAILDAWDLVTITDPSQGINQVPVRLTSWEENDKLEIACVAEPFVYGIHAPQALPATVPIPYNGGSAIQSGAGNVNPPIIFEPVNRLYGSLPQLQLWLVISSAAANFGGAQVFVSTDGGASFNPLGDPVLGSAVTGVLTADWPAAADPDTTNDLLLDLTESNGTLNSYPVSDEDNFVYPCYVEGQQLIVQMNGTTIAILNNTTIEMNGTAIASSGAFGYELMTYAVANMTGANLYTLKATGGNHLRRDVFSAPDGTGMGIDHPATSRFAFLNPSGVGIFKATMDPVWVGQTLQFKILSFNEFGTALQSLSDVPAYSYTPTGVPGA